MTTATQAADAANKGQLVTAGLIHLDESRLQGWLNQFEAKTGLSLHYGRTAGVFAIYCLPEEKDRVRQVVLSEGLDSLREAIRAWLKELGHLSDADIERCVESPFTP